MLDLQNIKKIYLIAEIGINHNGDLSVASRLIDAARSIGWDSIKFQKRTPEVCVPEHQKSLPKKTPWGDMTYLEYKEKIEFGKSEYDYINSYCNQKFNPIDWSASVWDLKSLEFLIIFDSSFGF